VDQHNFTGSGSSRKARASRYNLIEQRIPVACVCLWPEERRCRVENWRPWIEKTPARLENRNKQKKAEIGRHKRFVDMQRRFEAWIDGGMEKEMVGVRTYIVGGEQKWSEFFRDCSSQTESFYVMQEAAGGRQAGQRHFEAGQRRFEADQRRLEAVWDDWEERRLGITHFWLGRIRIRPFRHQALNYSSNYMTVVQKNLYFIIVHFVVDYRQCCVSGMFIKDPGSWFLSIPDIGSRIQQQKQQQKRGKYFVVLPFFGA
jgi:hypothetical protein